MKQGSTLLTSSQTFRVCRYGVSHSELILRSGHVFTDDPVELLFEDVRSMHFDKLQFPTLTVRRCEDVILQSKKYDHPYLRIELRTPDHTGHVVCGRLTYFHGSYSTGTRQWCLTTLRTTELR